MRGILEVKGGCFGKWVGGEGVREDEEKTYPKVEGCETTVGQV